MLFKNASKKNLRFDLTTFRPFKLLEMNTTTKSKQNTNNLLIWVIRHIKSI